MQSDSKQGEETKCDKQQFSRNIHILGIQHESHELNGINHHCNRGNLFSVQHTSDNSDE